MPPTLARVKVQTRKSLNLQNTFLKFVSHSPPILRFYSPKKLFPQNSFPLISRTFHLLCLFASLFTISRSSSQPIPQSHSSSSVPLSRHQIYSDGERHMKRKLYVRRKRICWSQLLKSIRNHRWRSPVAATLSASLFRLRLPKNFGRKDPEIRSKSYLILFIFLTLSFAMLFFLKILMGMMFLVLCRRVGRMGL